MSITACTHDRRDVQADRASVSLDVMSFNIRYDNPADGENAWPKRRNHVAGVVRFYDPDIVGVQEALSSQLEDLANDLPGYTRIGVGRDDGGSAGEHTAILVRTARLDVEASDTFWLSLTPDVPGSKGWDAGLPRIVSWARLRDRDSGVGFAVFNTHFDNRGPQARAESAALLTTQIDQLAAGMPVILTGDFNTPPDSEPYRILTLRLIDSRLAAGERAFGPAATFLGFFARPLPEGAVAGQRPIDYVFVTPGIEVIRHGHLAHHWFGRHPSVHVPVVASLILRPSEEVCP